MAKLIHSYKGQKMNVDVFVLLHLIVTCHGNTFWKHMLRVSFDSNIGFFELMNLANVHCGVNETTTLYRHDWLDSFDVSCVHSFYLILGNFDFYQKYTVFTDGENIETILGKQPDFIAPTTRNDIVNSGDQYLTNSGNYEFLSLNPAGDKIYVGIYKDTSSDNYPKLVYNPTGSSYSAGQDPTGFPNIERASFVDINAAMHDTEQCRASFVSTNNNIGDCPTLPNVTTTSTSPRILGMGATLSLDCSHSTTLVNDVYWMFRDTNGLTTRIDSTTDPSKYAGSTKSAPSLDVYSFSTADQGTYKCFVQNVIGLGQSTGIVATLTPGPPSLTIPVYTYELVIGGNVKLNCTATGTPAVDTISWKRNSAVITDCGTTGRLSGMSLSQHSLIISDLESCDAAEYQCCAGNTEGHACAGNIILDVKPTVTVPTAPVIAIKESAQVTISCTVTSNIAVTGVSWNITTNSGNTQFNGGTSGKYSGSSSGSPSLIISSPADSDVGQYICTGTNAIGSTTSSTVELVVYGVTATVPSTTASAVYGDNVELQCTVTGVPDVTSVRWEFHHNSTVIDMTNTAKYTGSTLANPSLRILGATFDDMWDYHCVAENAHHSHTSADVTLTVTGAIPTVTTNQQYVTANQSQSVTIFCGATGSPTVQSVYWKMKDGSNIPGTTSGGTVSSPSLVFSNPQPSDSGAYVCYASNAVGEGASATVNLTINAVEAMCPCACYYKERLAYWAAQNITNHTMDELRIILAPVLKKLEKDLRVDTSNLSATIREKTSAKDSRQSSTSIGIVGILFLTVVLGGLFLIDATSFPRYIKQMCRIKQ